MKISRWILIGLCVLGLSATNSMAFKGVVSTPEDIVNLKTALNERRIEIGNTRLDEVRARYGEAPKINSNEKSITYDYGDLSIEFEVKKYWKSWGYDSFKNPAYTKKINDLRYSLESQKLVGDEITWAKIRKDYEEPTEAQETNNDGGTSTYYYGNIKLVFENVIVVKGWKADKLGMDEGTQNSNLVSQEIKTPPPSTPPKEKTPADKEPTKDKAKESAKETQKETSKDALKDIPKETTQPAGNSAQTTDKMEQPDTK